MPTPETILNTPKNVPMRWLRYLAILVLGCAVVLHQLVYPAIYAKLATAAATMLLMGIFVVQRLREAIRFADIVGMAASISIVALLLARTLSGDRIVDHPALLTLAATLAVAHLVSGGYRALRLIGSQRHGPEKWTLALSELIPAKVAALAVTELRILYFAVNWWTPPVCPLGTASFSYHRNMLPMLISFVVLAMIEATVLHLLVSLWSPTATWILFILSDLTIVYLVGLINSMRKLPLLISDLGVQINAGTLIQVWLPIESIAGVYPTAASEPIERSSILKATLLSSPTLYIRLTSPMPIIGPFGKRKVVKAIGIHPDNSEAFANALTLRCRESTYNS